MKRCQFGNDLNDLSIKQFDVMANTCITLEFSCDVIFFFENFEQNEIQ